MMEADLETILLLMTVIVAAIVFLAVLVVRNKRRHSIRAGKIKAMDQYLIGGMLAGTEFSLRSSGDITLFVDRFAALKQLLALEREADRNFYKLIAQYHVVDHFRGRIGSRLKFRRIEAAVYLGVIGDEDCRRILEQALQREPDASVRLYLINSLVDIAHPDSIGPIVDTIFAAPRWYQAKAQALVFVYGRDFFDYLSRFADTGHPAVKSMIVEFAAVTPLAELRPYLLAIAERNDEEPALVHRAVQGLAAISPADLDADRYLDHPDAGVRAVAIDSLAYDPSDATLYRLADMLAVSRKRRSAILALSRLLADRPRQINLLTAKFLRETDPVVKTGLAEVIGNRIEYLLLKLSGKDCGNCRDIVREVVLMGKISNIIGFLNKNKNIELENEILAIIKPAMAERPKLQREFRVYLNDRMLGKCGLTRPEAAAGKKAEEKDRKVIAILYGLIAAIVLLFPLLYVVRRHEILFTMPLFEQLKLYVIDFNYYLVYYSSAINGIYILILLVSFIGVYQQSRYWQLKKVTYLFKKGIMPSISIIAPAFNEEATIIESANSLMNLKYPDYELIIVNDGSKDNTIQTLIQYFNLEKVDVEVNEQLATKPIRGIYRNKSMPKLTVVDKENGGKADSLNTGINISSKEYFCGIDADSLLETDALLKLTSQVVDATVECPAMGGNIFPINGCRVDKGLLLDLHIPANPLARLQTIEYIRAFMAGRVGWAYLECLLIISGAFGLFKKDRIIEIGGYLTSSGKYHKDTVGEDMELVVRLSRHMLETKQKFKVNYAFNANCWTEVPESHAVLKRQRDRWHRGLIDILTFHRKIMGNPRYGKIGMIAFPYFFIFEMMGPLVEIQGYAMVVLATGLGLLNAKVALLLFISTILLGIVISLASLYLAEKETDYFSLNELAILIAYAIAENFGPRQIISLWRVTGYINSLKTPKGWGKMERKGFAGAAAPAGK